MRDVVGTRDVDECFAGFATRDRLLSLMRGQFEGAPELNATARPTAFPLSTESSATLAERSNWESNAATAAMLREQAMALYQQAHQARRDAMYQRGRR